MVALERAIFEPFDAARHSSRTSAEGVPIQVVPRLHRAYPRRNPLMPPVSRQAIETLRVYRNDAHRMTARQLHQILCPRIIARAIYVNLLYRCCVLAQPACHRVKAVDYLSGVQCVVPASSTKSILLVSMSTRTTLTLTRSPSL